MALLHCSQMPVNSVEDARITQALPILRAVLVLTITQTSGHVLAEIRVNEAKAGLVVIEFRCL